MEGKKITLDNGFTLKVDVDILDDWDVFALLRQIDKGDAGAIVELIPLVLGEGQFKKLKEHMSKNGRVKASAMVDIFTELITKLQALKN